MIGHELALRAGQIDASTEPLELARAREGFRAWAWIGERRVAGQYAQQQRLEVTMPQLGPALQELEERRAARQAVASPAQCAAPLPVLPSVGGVTDVTD